jgi:hypothetical protein
MLLGAFVAVIGRVVAVYLVRSFISEDGRNRKAEFFSKPKREAPALNLKPVEKAS